MHLSLPKEDLDRGGGGGGGVASPLHPKPRGFTGLGRTLASALGPHHHLMILTIYRR